MDNTIPSYGVMCGNGQWLAWTVLQFRLAGRLANLPVNPGSDDLGKVGRCGFKFVVNLMIHTLRVSRRSMVSHISTHLDDLDLLVVGLCILPKSLGGSRITDRILASVIHQQWQFSGPRIPCRLTIERSAAD